MLIAFPVLPLLASTIVSPGRSSPSRSARSIMYVAIRALIDPDGLRNSSLTQRPFRRRRGEPPTAPGIAPADRPSRGSAAMTADAGSGPERITRLSKSLGSEIEVIEGV